MPGILVATGFVRIDSDTKPALKGLKALGSIGGNLLVTAIAPAAAAASTAILSVASAASVAGGAAAVYGAAVGQQFSQVTKALENQGKAEDAQTKAVNAKTIAQRLAKEGGFKYGQQVKITSGMTEEARQRAQNYNAALAQATSSTRAAKSAQSAYKTELSGMPKATSALTESITVLKKRTEDWSNSLASSTMPVFTRGVQFITALLPKLSTLVRGVSAEVDSFVDTLGEGSAGKVFRQFGENVNKNGADALRTFLDVARNLTVGVVGILNAFLPMSAGVTGGLETMTEKFADWGASLSGSGGFASFQQLAQDMGPRLVTLFGALSRAFVDVASSAGPMAGVGLQLVTVLAQLIDAIPTPVLQLLVPVILAVNTALKLYAVYQAAAAAVTWVFTTANIAGRTSLVALRIQLIALAIAQRAAAVASAIVTAATWAWSLAMNSTGIPLLIIGIAALVAAIIWIATKTTWFQTAWKYTWSFVKAVVSAVVDWFKGPFVNFFTKTIPGVFRTVLDWVKAYWPWILGALTGPIGLAVVAIAKNWGSIRAGMQAAWSAIVSGVLAPIGRFFTGTIPGWAARVRDYVVGAWHAMGVLLAGAYATIRNQVFNPIRDVFTKTIPGWAGTVRSQVVGRWNSLRDGLAAAYASIRSRVISPIRDFFTKTIPGYASTVRSQVVGRWNSLRDGLATAYASIRNRVFNPIRDFFTKTIPGWASTLKRRVVGFFTDMRDGIGVVWRGIQSKTKTPVNWVLKHVWNEGLVQTWKTITGWIGIGNALKPVKLLAAGGTVGKAQPGMFSKPTAIVGEGNPRYPEFVIPTDPKYATRARGLWEAAGAHFYAGGGILGTITDAIGSAAGGAASFGKGALDFFSDPTGKAKELLNKPLKQMSHIGSSPWAQMIKTLPHKAVDGLLQAVKKVGSSALGAVGLGPSGGGSGVKRWTGVVQQALRMTGQPAGYTAMTLRRMNQESGGNPNVVNKWDSNWRLGYPSVGLMQVIRPTFQSHAGKLRKTGPFKYGVSVNPLANTYASMRYALSAYGSLPRAYNRAGGYALGTAGSSAGWHWTGENGPELMKLPAGTQVRSTRASARQAGAAAVVHLTVQNHGVIGSRREAEDWLAGSLDQLRRKGRLPAQLGGRS